MKSAREDVLDRIREALVTAALPAPFARASAAPRAAPDRATLLSTFEREATSVGCTVHGPVPREKVADTVLEILRKAHAHELLGWNAADLPVEGLTEVLTEHGFQFLDPVLPADRAGRAAQLLKLDGVDAGLTGALGGLADTGSLILGSHGRSRLTWLLPPVHIALLPIDKIHANLASFLESAKPTVQTNANLVFVTGPSRSGDIEQVLTLGVHGPGVVHVVLLASREEGATDS